jgi:hypothetical protein
MNAETRVRSRPLACAAALLIAGLALLAARGRRG